MGIGILMGLNFNDQNGSVCGDNYFGNDYEILALWTHAECIK